MGPWYAKVKSCVASGLRPLAAMKTMGYEPVICQVGYPVSWPVVPSKRKPEGISPLTLNAGAGAPVAVTVNEQGAESGVACVQVAESALVIAGGTAATTVNEKLWTASGLTPLLAVKEIG